MFSGFEGVIGEIIVGVVLLGFAAAFRNWANTVKDSFTKVMTKLELITQQFHEHSLTIERRVTRVETKVDSLTNGKKIETKVGIKDL